LAAEHLARELQPFTTPESNSALFVKSATNWIMVAFTFGEAVIMEPELNGGSGSY
jgi:hypothetical protein